MALGPAAGESVGLQARLGAGPDERTLIAAPMFHATGVVSQFVGFFTGGACCVMVPEFHAGV